MKYFRIQKTRHKQLQNKANNLIYNKIKFLHETTNNDCSVRLHTVYRTAHDIYGSPFIFIKTSIIPRMQCAKGKETQNLNIKNVIKHFLVLHIDSLIKKNFYFLIYETNCIYGTGKHKKKIVEKLFFSFLTHEEKNSMPAKVELKELRNLAWHRWHKKRKIKLEKNTFPFNDVY